MGTKKGRIYDKGAPINGHTDVWRGAVAPNCSSLDPPLPSVYNY